MIYISLIENTIKKKWLSNNGITVIRGLVREGYSSEDVANYIHVPPDTLADWCEKSPDLSNAFKNANPKLLDCMVEEALLRRAVGFETVERKIEVSPTGQKKETQTIKQVAPDLSAITLWLKLRAPKRWGDDCNQQTFEQNDLLQCLFDNNNCNCNFVNKEVLDDLPELQ